MTKPFLLAAALAALAALAAGAAAMGSLPPGSGPAAGPFACALTAREGGGGTDLEARVEAREALSGHYALSVRGAGLVVEQSGEFTAKAGETLTLGEASLPGPASALDATMTLTAGGRTTGCPLRVL